jgi:hypothetical protein
MEAVTKGECSAVVASPVVREGTPGAEWEGEAMATAEPAELPGL